MNEAKRKRLEAKGWQVRTVAKFLALMPEETAAIETKLPIYRRTQPRASSLPDKA